MKWKVPLSDIDLNDREIEKVTEVLRSRWLSMGPVTQQFEEAFARFLGVKHAFAVASGTAALHIAYKVLGLGAGDEVILPSMTFVATANAVLYTGAQPVFADISDVHDFNISPADIENKITPRTKAIAVVHYAGYPCQMDKIMTIARAHNIQVVEDAAHAPGAEFKGRKVGTFGDVGCFSFFATKNLVTGEGGMVVTNDDDLAGKVRVLRSHGMTSLTWDRHHGPAFSYDVVEAGFNYRLWEVASALGLIQLQKLEDNIRRRREYVAKYRKLLTFSDISLPFQHYPDTATHYIFPVLLSSEEVSRHSFMEEMRSRGVQTSIHYPPIHLFSYYRQRFSYTEGMLPKTEYVGQHEVTLPLHSMLKVGDIEYVAHSAKEILMS